MQGVINERYFINRRKEGLTIWTRGVAILPPFRTPIAECGLAPRANHMQTSRLPLNQVIAARACLPTFALRKILDCLGRFVFLAESPGVCLLSAVSTRLALAFLARPNIAHDSMRR